MNLKKRPDNPISITDIQPNQPERKKLPWHVPTFSQLDAQDTQSGYFPGTVELHPYYFPS